MKKRPSLIILVSTLTLLNGGCGGSPSDNPSPSPSPSAVPTPPVVPSPSPQAAVSPSPKASPGNLSVLGLIPSTLPNQRRQDILAGRTNPFALIPVEATIRQSVCQAPPPPKPGAVAMAVTNNNPPATQVIKKVVKKTAIAKNTAPTKVKKGSIPPVANLPQPSSRFGDATDGLSNPVFSGNPFTPTPNNQANSSSVKSPTPAQVSPQKVVKAPGGSSKTTTVKVVKSTNPSAIAALPSQVVIKKQTVKAVNPRSVVSSNPKTLANQPKKVGKNSAILAKAPSPPNFAIPEMVPTEAKAVEVSGVMEIGSKPFAIVKAPGEPVARYVGVGSRLSNGTLRVSAINTSADNPSVTVEQYGISVIRGVGDPPEAAPKTEGTSSPLVPNAIDNSRSVPSINYFRTISPKARSGFGVVSVFMGLPTQYIAQLPSNDNREVPTFEAVPKGPISVSLVPPDNSGFGEVRNLSLLALRIQLGGSMTSTKTTGVICNSGKTSVKVGDLTLQVEDKTSNTILDSLVINFPKTYNLRYGQKLEFDGSIPDIRGRNLKNVTVKLIDWSSGKP